MRNYKANYVPKYLGLNRANIKPAKRLFICDVIETSYKDIYSLSNKEDASKELYSYSKKNESLDNSHLWFVSESIHRLSHTFTLKEYTKYDIIKNVLIIIISKKRGKVNVRISIQWI